MSCLESMREILSLEDTDLDIVKRIIEAETKRRKHKGEPITGHKQLSELAANKGSVFFDNGMYARGYSAGFILNSSYSRITSLIENKKLFVYKK